MISSSLNMNQEINKDCCYLCDTYLTSIPNKSQIGAKGNVVEIISTVKKYLPKINKWQFDLICQSCLNDISHFDEIRRKWENNEPIFKRKIQDRFKGVNDFSNSKKKKSTYICRLCLNAINTQEVTFVYHDNQVYESSYVHKMLALHSPYTDLSLTENPVICNECLDEIQTFDAFYKMWLQVQCTDRHVNSCEGDVQVQLKNFDDNTEAITGHNLTEEESVTSTLSNVADLLGDKLDFTNGISTGKDLNDDICLISDDEEIENQINKTVKINTFNEAENAVRSLLNDEDSVCNTPEEFQQDVCIISDDEDIETNKDIKQNSRPISKEHDLAQIINVKENIVTRVSDDHARQVIMSESEGLSYGNECDDVDSARKVVENLEINNAVCGNQLLESNAGPFLIANNGFLFDNLSGIRMPGREEFTLVEVDDSDSQDSDDCEELNTHLLPKIANVCSVNENDIVTNETNMFEGKNSLQHFVSDTDFSNEPVAEIIPSIEINMTKVKQLLQNSPGGTTIVSDDSNEFEISPQESAPSLDINMSKVKEIFQNVDSASSNKESNLEEKLSDFLQFNKPVNSKRSIDMSNELLDFEHCQLDSDDAVIKKFKVHKKSTSPPKNDYTFLSAFEDFVVTKGKVPEKSLSCVGSKGASENSEEGSDVIVSNDNLKYYCKWYPYKQRLLNKSKSRKKIKATVMENLSGTQIYRCNKCLLAVDKECDLLSHLCVKSGTKLRFPCINKRCRFSSQEERKLLLHSVFHNLENLGWFKCSICEFHTLDDYFMAQHYKQNHQVGIVQRNSKCPHCYFESDDRMILSHHIKRRHKVDNNTQIDRHQPSYKIING